MSPAPSSNTARLVLKLARGLSNPARLVRSALVRFGPEMPLEVKLALDLYDRPNYAYGLFRAAGQAQALGLPAISSLELGVGMGEGLLAMESIAPEIEAQTGVRIAIYGFDLGEGLPAPRDYRDLPYLYGPGFYRMDQTALRQRLHRSELIFGDVAQTIPAFVQLAEAPPIGFVAFDLDFYSSTRASLALFEGEFERTLPRVLCYFDDISNEDALQTEFTGELLAVQEFNAEHPFIKIDRIAGFGQNRIIPDVWNTKMFVCHSFRHPLYDTHIVKGAEYYVPPIAPEP